MEKYIGVKQIKAEPMDLIPAEELLNRKIKAGNEPGYLVEYEDGYRSWSPKSVFEKAYRRTDGMSFGLAIEAAKKGLKIAREGWNGKDMFVVMQPPLDLPPFNTQGTARKVNDRTAKFIGEDAALHCPPYFAMKAANGDWVCGWLASQTDMLADDWMIVD